jgi:MFS family permease
MGVGRFAFTPLLPMMQADAGIPIAAGSALASANYIGYLAGALAVLSIRVDVLVAIRASLVATAVSTLAMGLTDSYTVWIALRAITGFASAFLLVYVSAWALERAGAEPLSRAGVFSGVGMGIFVVGVACLTFNATGVGAAGSWIALGLGSYVVTALVWRAYEAPVAEIFRGRVTSCPTRLLDSGVRRNDASVVMRAWRPVLAYAAAGLGYIIPATFLPTVARAQSTNSVLVDLAWPALGIAAFASTFLAARIFPGACVLRVWKWAQIIMALGIGLPVLSHTLPALVASGVCVGGTFMVITMAAMEAARDLGGREPRRLMAVMTTAFALGQIAGPLVVALLLGADGDLSRPFTFAALVLAAGVLVLPNATACTAGIARKEA